jgi:hypothetical protein
LPGSSPCRALTVLSRRRLCTTGGRRWLWVSV